MDYGDYFKFAAALILVLGLIGLLSVALRRYGGMIGGLSVTSRMTDRSFRRLSVEEILPLDGRRRLVLVRRDDTEHLLLLGHDGDRVVEAGIAAEARGLAEAPTRPRAGGMRAAAGGFRAMLGGASSKRDRAPEDTN